MIFSRNDNQYAPQIFLKRSSRFSAVVNSGLRPKSLSAYTILKYCSTNSSGLTPSVVNLIPEGAVTMPFSSFNRERMRLLCALISAL